MNVKNSTPAAQARSSGAATLRPNRATRRALASGRIVAAVSASRPHHTERARIAPAGQSASDDASEDSEAPGAEVHTSASRETASAPVLTDEAARAPSGDVASDARNASIEPSAAPSEIPTLMAGAMVSEEPVTESPRQAQYNAHDVDALMSQNNKLLTAIAELSERTRTPPPSLALLRNGAESFALCQILVEKGIVSETEMGARVMLRLQGVLGEILAQYESLALRTPTPQKPERGGLVTPSNGGIQVVRR